MIDHYSRMLVEPSCGSALAMLYSADSLDLGNLSNDGAVVVVVCGGNMTTIDLFDEWRQQFNLL